MMPCKFCGFVDQLGRDRRGIRQFGKTKRDGIRFVKRYRCLDCGAVCIMTVDVKTNAYIDAWKSAEPGSQFVVDARGIVPAPRRDQVEWCAQSSEQDNAARPPQKCLNARQNGKLRGSAVALTEAFLRHHAGYLLIDWRAELKDSDRATVASPRRHRQN